MQDDDLDINQIQHKHQGEACPGQVDRTEPLQFGGPGGRGSQRDHGQEATHHEPRRTENRDRNRCPGMTEYALCVTTDAQFTTELIEQTSGTAFAWIAVR